MSEYQIVKFRAIDRPLTDKHIEFMHRQYREAASILADLRDAIGGEEGSKIARKHAAHLAKKYPTLNLLKSSLRKKKLLD